MNLSLMRLIVPISRHSLYSRICGTWLKGSGIHDMHSSLNLSKRSAGYTRLHRLQILSIGQNQTSVVCDCHHHGIFHGFMAQLKVEIIVDIAASDSHFVNIVTLPQPTFL